MPTIKHTRDSIAKLEQERDQFKRERDSLIKDVEKFREALIKTQNSTDELMDIQAHRDLLREFSKFIDYKLYIHPGNYTYLSYRNELDQLGICKERE